MIFALFTHPELAALAHRWLKVSWSPQQSSYMAQQERKWKHITSSGFLLLLLRFVLRKLAHVQQLDQPEAEMPSDKCFFQLQGKMGFGKHLNYGALNHQRTTPLLVQVMNYTSTHSSMVCQCSHWGLPAVSLAEPAKMLVWCLTFQHCHSSWNMTYTCYLNFQKGYSLFDLSPCFPEETCFPFSPLNKASGLSSPSKTDTS